MYAVCLEYAHSLSALTQYGDSSAFTSMTTGLTIAVGPPYPYWQGSHSKVRVLRLGSTGMSSARLRVLVSPIGPHAPLCRWGGLLIGRLSGWEPLKLVVIGQV